MTKIIILKTDPVFYKKIIDLAAKEKGNLKIISSFEDTTLVFPGLEINCGQQRVFLNGKELKLTPNEYALLYLLASQAGHTVPKKIILETIWGKDTENTMKVVANTVSNLRKKIETDRQHPQYIQTVLGGYLFALPIC